MLHDDSKQRNLTDLFAELRRIKQEELPEDQGDSASQAYHDERVRSAIRRIEEKIEREMDDVD